MKNFEFNDIPFSSSIKSIKYDSTNQTLDIIYKGSPGTIYTYGKISDEVSNEIKRIITFQYLNYSKSITDKSSNIILEIPVENNEIKTIEIGEEFGWVFNQFKPLSNYTIGQFVSKNIKPYFHVINKTTTI